MALVYAFIANPAGFGIVLGGGGLVALAVLSFLGYIARPKQSNFDLTA